MSEDINLPYNNCRHNGYSLINQHGIRLKEGETGINCKLVTQYSVNKKEWVTSLEIPDFGPSINSLMVRSVYLCNR